METERRAHTRRQRQAREPRRTRDGDGGAGLLAGKQAPVAALSVERVGVANENLRNSFSEGKERVCLLFDVRTDGGAVCGGES